MIETTPPEKSCVRVWDGFTRLFHWSLVGLITAQFYTAFKGPIELHIRIGEALLALVLARIVWGFIGSSNSRFSGFIRDVRAVRSHIRSLLSEKSDDWAGHNPAGGWMVLLMLILLAVQLGLGLFASDPDDFIYAPLAARVTTETSETLTHLHHRLGIGLLVVIGIHVTAILVYALIKRVDLVSPMLSGKKDLGPAGQAAAAKIRFRPLWLGLLILGLSAAGLLLLP